MRRAEEAAATRLDAAAWALLPALALLALPVGLVTPDGLGHANLAAAGFSAPNPNHLLLEPLGVITLRATAWLAPALHPADRLRWLSAAAGALALALFRAGVAPRFAAGRAAANYATAWLALGAAFSHLWLSAECHIIQMPPVVAAVIAFCQLRERPRTADAVGLGIAIGVAALCFASLALLLPSAVAALAIGRSRTASLKESLAAVLGFGAVCIPAFLAAWGASAHDVGILSWLSSYGGSGDLGRLRGVYGAPTALAGVLVAGVRAAYGIVCSVVDLMPAVAAWRDSGEVAMPIVRILAAAAAALALAPALLRLRGDGLAVSILLGAPTVVFGWAWNDSADQFYLPFAVVAAILAAASAASRAAVGLGLLVLAFNAGDLATSFVLYPRSERMAELSRATAGACLVVYPGFDEEEVLFGLGAAPPSATLLTITALAVAEPVDRGLARLRAAVEPARSGACTAAFVDLYDRPPFEPPWKFLRALGYDPDAVRRTLGGLRLENVTLPGGRFDVRRSLPGR